MSLKLAISDVSDKNMLDRADVSNHDISSNRKTFLIKNGIDVNHTVMINTTYNTKDFRRYKEARNENPIVSDAVVTSQLGQALLLPIADCLGAVIYDPNQNILMLSHLGRHHLLQNGGYHSIKYLVENYQCKPDSLLIYFSPSAGKDNYPLLDFQNRSISEIATQQFLKAGVEMHNITPSNVDTTQDFAYYSHSEFLKGNRDKDGRFVVVAQMN